ncbi:Xaa-Pro dipeptidase [Ferrimonas lipolytica]|uniref:Xaa-Pro dipeptidase n=1 Tax=Ferrimonas lipolytica TaxID=2724191 RepID=A0A6H1UGH0_9GAMM|nr:Xaa-Pro dipeptidase [Ferrimonas lipolytica]QIZ78205.1 Xaa-Pro dipeptidase [Ferrimonas lipolytica]
MEAISKHYPLHIHTLRQRTDAILEEHQLAGLVIDAGYPAGIFLDDMEYPFKVNPHFKHWVPLTDNPHCMMIIRAGEKPTLLYYRPVDFWHKVAPLPTESWVEQIDLIEFSRLEQLLELMPADKQNYAYIGAHADHAEKLGLSRVNPQELLNAIHFGRSIKTQYEIECMREANRIAVLGHEAARDAFMAGATEFEIQQAYLAATGHGENEVPYGNIIAINQNSAILHYTKLERIAPQQRLSFLIDAGASVNGYAADITRTYAYQQDNLFAQLVATMNQHQQQILTLIKPGLSYTDLHIEMHKRVAQMLNQFELASGDEQTLIDLGVTKAFYPHGLGHPIGLQVHDVAGFMQDADGTELAAPEGMTLRCTRVLEEGMVITIEPGLYVIDSLLSDLSDEAKALLNPVRIDELRPYGGVRIEDDVVVLADGIDNLTRGFNLA